MERCQNKSSVMHITLMHIIKNMNVYDTIYQKQNTENIVFVRKTGLLIGGGVDGVGAGHSDRVVGDGDGGLGLSPPPQWWLWWW